MEVTPWAVSDDIDYEKLIKEFGVKPLDSSLRARLEKLAGEEHYMLRRNIFFSHMYFDKILDTIEKGDTVYLYTGRAPSGPVHLGHIIPWIFTKWLQDKLDLTLIFQIPDEEKFLFKDNLTFEDTAKWTKDNLKDIMAVGFNPEKTKFLIDTKHAGLMYQKACEVAKKTTASTVKALFGLQDSDNVGKYFYSCMQSVPCFVPTILEGKRTPVLIPCAIDQDVHFRLTRDVAEKLGYPKPSTILCRFLPPLEGGGKMSTTEAEHAVINMSDDAKTIKKKVNKYAFSGGQVTVEEHREKGGDPDIDMSFQWLTFLEEDDSKLEDIRSKYKSGELLSGELKQILIDKLTEILEAHQKRKETVDPSKSIIEL